MSPILSDLDRDRYAAMDDCADWANGEARCSGEPCRHGQVACPVASACHVPPKPRLGPLRGIERSLLNPRLRLTWGSLAAWTAFIALLSAWYATR